MYIQHAKIIKIRAVVAYEIYNAYYFLNRIKTLILPNITL
ncbi:hypothetical protein BACSTE_02046 [Bacteroides stercoris ATCC 43183]|uniref:Uncharacterized protein n=1 Tax=Bacteroides stercoris ATCC 43183 TaxID=449673 RepID=B0NQ26_BACSE|nr:hypothetical protein BACSTE_02046 [Bacteroides stercoris ATCC 43183]